MTPTQRTKAALKEHGMPAGMVEHWNPHVRRGDGGMGIRQDLFGIIDIIALDKQNGVVGIQSTGTDFAGHMRKMTVDRRAACIDWLQTPGTFLELWAWRKVKVKRGGKKMIYQPRIHRFTLEDFKSACSRCGEVSFDAITRDGQLAYCNACWAEYEAAVARLEEEA